MIQTGLVVKDILANYTWDIKILYIDIAFTEHKHFFTKLILSNVVEHPDLQNSYSPILANFIYSHDSYDV